MKVLVTGGAGYIGSHTVLALLAAGHDAVIVDSYVNSSPKVVSRLAKLAGRSISAIELDVADYALTDQMFQVVKPDAVIHFAGLKAVGESVAQPLRYYRNNLDSALSIVAAMQNHDVDKLVFSSSATVYGEKAPVPYREADEIVLESTNPYGQTKVIIERILEDTAIANPGWRVANLRYFNPVGAHPSGDIGEDPLDIPNNLMPYIAQVAVGRRDRLTVHGNDYPTADGTGERDYLHVMDLADAHVAALEHLADQAESCRAYNLGTGTPTSVLQLLAAFERAAARPLPYQIGPRRAGDLASNYADPTRAATELGWRASRSIDEMCADTWRWQSRNPQGYN